LEAETNLLCGSVVWLGGLADQSKETTMDETDSTDSIDARFAEYDDFVEQTGKWLKKRADRFHWYYNFSRTGLVLLSISIPAMTSNFFGPGGVAAVPYVALAIAILGALDGLFKPGDNWRHFRSYQLALQRYGRVSSSRRTELSLLDTGEEQEQEQEQRALALYKEFVLDIEQLLEEESKKFFEHQIQQLKRE